MKQFSYVDETMFIQDSMHFIIGNNLKYLVCVLNSNIIQWLIKIIVGEAAGGNAGNADNIWNLPIIKPHSYDNYTPTDAELYALYHLTEEEISIIEKDTQ